MDVPGLVTALDTGTDARRAVKAGDHLRPAAAMLVPRPSPSAAQAISDGECQRMRSQSRACQPETMTQAWERSTPPRARSACREPVPDLGA